MSKPDGVPRRLITIGGLFAFLAVFAFQYSRIADANSLTWDEGDHIYAGYMSWMHRDFGLNPEHPPMVKLVSALPLLGMQLKMPPLLNRRYEQEAFLGGKDFIFKNDANTIVYRARMAAMLFTLLLAALVFLTARDFFGTGAGFLALALMAFDPTVLAHGAVVTTDSAQACFMLATVYTFYRYWKSPGLWRLVAVGAAAGLALASKHSTILLVPAIGLLAVWELIRRPQPGAAEARAPIGRHVLRTLGGLVAMSVIAVGILWGFYGFRYAARAEGRKLSPSLEVNIQNVPSKFQGAVLTKVATLHLLPESYIFGLSDVLAKSKGYHSFLFGKSYPTGIWYYFPVGMLLKSTLTFLLLFGALVWALVTGRFRPWREILYLTILPAVYMAFSMAGGMNIGIRHMLPVYVFLFVLISGAVWAIVRNNRKALYVVIALLVFQAISVSRVYPAYVAYANEAVGGPMRIHEYMTDSSVDWAQQMKSVKRYLDAHEIRNCWFAYFAEGVLDYSYYGIPCQPLPTADSMWAGEPANAPPSIDGPVLISAGILSGYEFGPGLLNPYEQFRAMKPDGQIDYGVFVFNGHFEIPLAAALSHSQKAGLLLAEKKVPEALDEARQAVALGPMSVSVNTTMARALEADGQSAEALAYYQTALRLARTVEPAFQEGRAAALEKRLAKK
ncbi:MAG TPA: glycosyltransferase family 39 protein [Verrucomicrobiae bacterium]|nr:glycosyltransferase family 39 protein [Verrucomicrobiae bacterium]